MTSSIEENNIAEDSYEKTLDVSGKTVEFSIFENSDEKVDSSVEGLYLYKNVFSFISKTVSEFGKLKFLKFYGNEVNLFTSEVGTLAKLESLQMKISSPWLTACPFADSVS